MHEYAVAAFSKILCCHSAAAAPDIQHHAAAFFGLRGITTCAAPEAEV
jgi:hypothetical protein